MLRFDLICWLRPTNARALPCVLCCCTYSTVRCIRYFIHMYATRMTISKKPIACKKSTWKFYKICTWCEWRMSWQDRRVIFEVSFTFWNHSPLPLLCPYTQTLHIRTHILVIVVHSSRCNIFRKKRWNFTGGTQHIYWQLYVFRLSWLHFSFGIFFFSRSVCCWCCWFFSLLLFERQNDRLGVLSWLEKWNETEVFTLFRAVEQVGRWVVGNLVWSVFTFS